MDHQTFDMQKYGGISRYFANLHHYLQSDQEFENQVALLRTENFYLKNDRFSNSLFTRFMLKRKKKQVKYNRQYSIDRIQKNDFDLFHPTYYDPYFLGHLKKPFVLTVHDMIHELYPEYFMSFDEFTKFKRLTIAKADHIIAISESTKKDLKNIYAIPDEKITVVYHGIDITKKTKQQQLSQTDSPYILYIGDRTGYKNFFNFLNAFKKVIFAYPDLKLVCTGSSFNSIETEFILRNRLSNNIIQIGATEEELNALYQHAICYVSPSLLEGFGFPILEAFTNDCITLLSDTGCFREIAGEGAIYFDPLSIKSMTECMISVVSGFSGRAEKIRQGHLQLQKFPLEKSMKETKAVYQNILL